MKVLLIDQIAKVNYKYTFPLANGLVKAGEEVTLVIDQKQEKENCLCERECLFYTDEKNVGKVYKLKNYVSSYKKIEKMIIEGKYDILHTEWYTFSPIDYYFIKKIKKNSGIKYIATVHDILPFNQKFYDFKFHKKLYSLADKIILQAPDNMQRFSGLFPNLSKKTIMIPHGHMLDYVDCADKYESRKKLGIPDDKFVFLFFGQIKKVKGVDILLKAFSSFNTKHTESYLVIAGSVWKSDFAECQKIIDNNNLSKNIKLDIRYIPDDEVKYYYSASDVCVLPYTDVYQSGVIQLAYGYKKAVISSDLPAFTQFVKSGITGFVALRGDSNSLETAMENAYAQKEKLETLGRNGYELVKRELSWDNLAKRIVDECYM